MPGPKWKSWVEIERSAESFELQHLPQEVASDFKEALTCYSNSCGNASAAMTRRALQSVATHLGSEGSTLPVSPRPKYSMIRKLVLYSFVFVWGGCCVCAAQAMFSTEREFGPVRLSQEQLLELVDRLRVFAEQQGSIPAGSDDASQILSLSDGQSTLRISEEISMETLDSAPPVATSVYYEYSNRTGVISSISIRLRDTRRTLEISGRSRDQVEAAASVASKIISQARTTVGGSFHRIMWAGGLITVGLILVLVPDGFAFRPKVYLALKLTGTILTFSVWLFPWEEWFPGSAVYRDDASFLVRHAALISFLGFLVAFVALFWSVVRHANSTQSSVKTEVAPTATEGD